MKLGTYLEISCGSIGVVVQVDIVTPVEVVQVLFVAPVIVDHVDEDVVQVELVV